MNQLMFSPYNFLSSLYNVQNLALGIEGRGKRYIKYNIQVSEFSEKLKNKTDYLLQMFPCNLQFETS